MYNCSIFWVLRNLQEQVKKAFCYQKLFWPFTVWINCSSDLKKIANSQPSASNYKSFSQSLEQFFLTVVQYNFGTKIYTIFPSCQQVKINLNLYTYWKIRKQYIFWNLNFGQDEKKILLNIVLLYVLHNGIKPFFKK